MRHVLLTAGLLLGPAVAAAQQTPLTPAALSLADAIAIARDQNPAYRQALNNRGPAAWGVRNAFTSLFIPSVTTAAGMTYTGPGSQTCCRRLPPRRRTIHTLTPSCRIRSSCARWPSCAIGTPTSSA